MLRTLCCLALAALALSAGACGSGEDAPEAERVPFDAARALGFARHLAEEIGPRPSGSPEARQAADYIADQFAGARFGVFRLEFEYEADPNRPASVAVGGSPAPAVTAAGSAPGRAAGPAVDIGTGDSAPAAGSLAGKVAVVRRGGSTTFFQKYEAARQAGAIAVVIVNSEPGLLTVDLGAGATIPVVAMEQGDARAVLAAAAQGAPVTVEVPPAQTVKGTDVVARARSAHACVYVMTANYDTLPGSAGADGNASGVAVMLELAYQLAAMEGEPAVCFIATDAGYARGAGALAYLRMTSSSSWPAVVVELHNVGGEGDLIVEGDRLLATDARSLADSFDVAAREGAGLLTPATEPFRAAGIPVLEVSRELPVPGGPDVAGGLRAGSLEDAGEVAGRLLIQLSAKSPP